MVLRAGGARAEQEDEAGGGSVHFQRGSWKAPLGGCLLSETWWVLLLSLLLPL